MYDIGECSKHFEVMWYFEFRQNGNMQIRITSNVENVSQDQYGMWIFPYHRRIEASLHRGEEKKKEMKKLREE